MTIKGYVSNSEKLEKLERGELTLKKSQQKRFEYGLRDMGDTGPIKKKTKKVSARLGKPYSQQPGRKAGKGAGKIKTEADMANEILGNFAKIPSQVSNLFDDKKYNEENKLADKRAEKFGKEVGKKVDDALKQKVAEIKGEPSKVSRETKETLRFNPGEALKVFPETGGQIDLSKVSDVDMDGIDVHDYPDFSDAFIASASYAGRDMTEDELDILNNDSQFVYDQIPDDIMASDDMEKSKRLGKPYSQQLGRKPGKGAGKIVAREESPENDYRKMDTGEMRKLGVEPEGAGGATCADCGQPMLSAKGCNQAVIKINGKWYEREPYYDETDGDMPRCPDCGTTVGNYHHSGCDQENCPRCGDQLIGCECNVGPTREKAPEPKPLDPKIQALKDKIHEAIQKGDQPTAKAALKEAFKAKYGHDYEEYDRHTGMKAMNKLRKILGLSLKRAR